MGIVFQDLDDRRADLERHKENSSRQAEAEGHFRTTGLGSIEFSTRVDFGVTFIRKPVVSYGHELDVDDLERVLDTWADKQSLTQEVKDLLVPDNGIPMMPMATGFVTDWQTDHKGFYTGAWCGVRVHFPPVLISGEVATSLEVTASIVMEHHFRFSQIGMKNVPTELTDKS